LPVLTAVRSAASVNGACRSQQNPEIYLFPTIDAHCTAVDHSGEKFRFGKDSQSLINLSSFALRGRSEDTKSH
jgi:hypothetical protein